MSLKYGYVRRCLADIRQVFGVHSTRELLLMLEICDFADAPAVRLSPRGKDVLQLFMRGLTYKQIGDRLGMSVSGVRRHREKMLWRNDCESLLELIVKYRGKHIAEDQKKDALSY
jgi:DNA-binding CsgD family transcriptional regulator